MSKMSWFRKWLSRGDEHSDSRPKTAAENTATEDTATANAAGQASAPEGAVPEASASEREQAQAAPTPAMNSEKNHDFQPLPMPAYEQSDLTEYAVAHALQELSAPHPLYKGLTMEQGLAMEEHITATSQNLFHHTPEFKGLSVHIHGEIVDLKPLVRKLASLGQGGGRVRMPQKMMQKAQQRFDDHMPTIVDEYITGQLKSNVIRDLSDLDFYRGIRVRISPIEDLLTEDWAREALATTDWIEGEPIPEFLESPKFPVRPWSSSTVIRLCVNHQGIIQNLTPELLETRDSLPELWHMGYRNLWQELMDSDLHVGSSTELETRPQTNLSSPNPEMIPDGELDVACWVFQGSSSFVGSLPLFLDEFMERMLPGVDISGGMIYGTPHRNMTVVSEVGSGPSVAGSMSVVFTLTAENHSLHPAPLSTEVNVLHHGQVEPIKQVASEEVDGGRSVRFEIQPPEYLIKRIMEGMKSPESQYEDGLDTDGPNRDEPNRNGSGDDDSGRNGPNRNGPNRNGSGDDDSGRNGSEDSFGEDGPSSES